MINVRGTFVWISDILEEILKGISKDGDISGLRNKVEVTGSTWTENYADSSELWNLWNQKKAELKVLGDETTYAKLYSNIGLFKTLNRGAISKSPYKSVVMDLKLGNMKAALNIPTKI